MRTGFPVIGLRSNRFPTGARGDAASMDQSEATGDGRAARRLAFERLTDQRLLKAYRLATLVMRDPNDAEDAVHDAAVQAWTHFDDLRDRSAFDAWFDRILINVCRRRLRQRSVRPVTMETTPEIPSVDGASRRAEQDVLRQALDRLSPEHRVVIVLHHLEGYSNAEIAARTGEREGTVKSRIHYALRELRAAYEAAEREMEPQR